MLQWYSGISKQYFGTYNSISYVKIVFRYTETILISYTKTVVRYIELLFIYV